MGIVDRYDDGDGDDYVDPDLQLVDMDPLAAASLARWSYDTRRPWAGGSVIPADDGPSYGVDTVDVNPRLL